MRTHYLHFIPIILFLLTTSNSMSAQDFNKYRERYEHFAENDSTAFLHLTPYIRQAKAEKNKVELVQAYKDAVSFSTTRKLSYADSMLWAASQSGRKDLLAQAHLTKGTVYYFNYHKFQPALDEYLKAWKITSTGSDPYLRYKNLYHIGVVKAYLGYHAEALDIFQQCHRFFNKPLEVPELPNKRFNRMKGYLNTLHQLSGCLLHLDRDEEARALILEGLQKTAGTSDFFLERSYFFKLQGIYFYKKQQYHASGVALHTALPGLEKKQDAANIALVYYYLGNGQQQLAQPQQAVHYFTAVDSLFRHADFLLPETRPALEYLITFHRQAGNPARELYFTTQLLRADRLILEDYRRLPRGIRQQYDKADLQLARQELESALYRSRVLTTVSAMMVLGLFGWLWYRRRASEPVTGEPSLPLAAGSEEEPIATPSALRAVPDAVVASVLHRLQKLEQKHFYLQPRMTLNKLAPLVKTNTSYLSRIIRDHYNCSFTEYLRNKRIAYLTQMLHENRQWRNYSLEHLAAECGFLEHKTFSAAFQAVHGVKPLDYITQLDPDKPAATEK
ncbi:AraC family transcriptional regulator [Chryseobacterium salipaludis]|uniref:helix-turn-helix domain-containing protein n=1 Tax=Chryseobacterium TaxID=59732 RepID=UPI001FF2E93D|nr:MULTISPECIES: AraC family transcriptional regulator [Chryseobacterium]MCJ8498619.1 AraC family transcriptional regulator [Chryseobacterium salipaludis]MCX3297731.1 AraC family transcriptional regulator [Planobacterium sp. JC490]